MSVSRIVKRNLQKEQLVKRRAARTWNDLRPRDKYGFLMGYCSQAAAKRQKQGKTV